MAESSLNQPRALAPRRLEQKESLQSLNHWRSVFRNYYRRCQYYGLFLLPTTTWDSSLNRGFTEDETTGLKRNIQTLAADLNGFLDCIGSYLPFDYVSDKLQAESTCIQSVWDLIYELYDAEISTSNFLDYASMGKLPEETYRSYYNRLVGFIRQHLPKDVVEVEGVTVPATGEKLTVALLDSVAIHWLLNIDKRLVSIVKTEFATDLKTKRLSQLVKQIAQNIDELLIRYDSKDQVALVKSNLTVDQQEDKSEIRSLVRRIEKLETKPFKKNRRGKFSFNANQTGSKQCSHCIFLNKQLGASLRTDHSSELCGKRSVSVNSLESVHCEEPAQESSSSSSDFTEGEKRILETPSNCILQTESEVSADCTENIVADVSQVNPNIACLVCPGARFCSKNATISDYNVHGQLISDEKLRVSENKQDLDQNSVGKTLLNKQKSESEFAALL